MRAAAGTHTQSRGPTTPTAAANGRSVLRVDGCVHQLCVPALLSAVALSLPGSSAEELRCSAREPSGEASQLAVCEATPGEAVAQEPACEAVAQKPILPMHGAK